MAISEADRTVEQKEVAREMPSLRVITETTAMHKKDLSDLEAKEKDLLKSCAKIDAFMLEAVDDSLYESYKEGRDESPNDRAGQVKAGIKKLKERIKNVMSQVALQVKSELMAEGSTITTSSVKALKKIERVKKLVKNSASLSKEFGTVIGITDDEAKAALTTGIRARSGLGNVPESIQTMLDEAVAGTLDFTQLCTKMVKLLEAITTRDRMSVGKFEDKERNNDRAAFKASEMEEEERVADAVKAFDYDRENAGEDQSGKPFQGSHHEQPAVFGKTAGRFVGQDQKFQAYQAGVEAGLRSAAGRGRGGQGRGGGGGQGGGAGRCNEWSQTGGCRFGSNCRFDHAKGGGARSESPRPRAFAADGNTSRGICHMWTETGRCSYGNNCRFDHPKDDGSRPGTPVRGGNKRKY